MSNKARSISRQVAKTEKPTPQEVDIRVIRAKNLQLTRISQGIWLSSMGGEPILRMTRGSCLSLSLLSSFSNWETRSLNLS